MPDTCSCEVLSFAKNGTEVQKLTADRMFHCCCTGKNEECLLYCLHIPNIFIVTKKEKQKTKKKEKKKRRGDISVLICFTYYIYNP